MKFSDRLAHLPPVTRSSGKSHGPSSPATTAPGSAFGGPAPLRDPEGHDPLAEVRAKLAQLTRNEAPAVGPALDAFEKLPFERVETELGPIYQRLIFAAPDHHVGRQSLDSASTTDTQLLSLLALDPRLSDCDVRGALFFDTETTGLGGAGTLAFLFGLSYQNAAGHWVLEQLLLRHPSEEVALLGRVGQLAQKASMLVSFNGRSFDWPLIQSRHVMNQLPQLSERPHLDLLHLSRRVHKRRLSSCRLVHLETEVLGFERGAQDIPGAEIAPRYGHFLRTGDEEALEAVIEHNAWDVWTMVALVGLYGQAWTTGHSEDLTCASETLLRAKSYDRAEAFAKRVMESGAKEDGLLLRARIRKARGDIEQALSDFETLSQGVSSPSVRLALAKLYEHYARDFARAAAVTKLGTGEDEEAHERRLNRLERKMSARQSRERCRK